MCFLWHFIEGAFSRRISYIAVYMLINLSIILILALALGWLFEKCRLPALLGMLVTGLLLGQNAKAHAATWMPNISPAFHEWAQNHLFLHQKMLDISEELRTLALIVILFRAGLGLKRKTLNEVGAPALRMSFIPCLLECSVVTIVAALLLPLTWIEAALLGCVIAAVSPAVIVPAMLGILEKGTLNQADGDETPKANSTQSIPTMILASAALDDVLAITLFAACLGLLPGSSEHMSTGIIDLLLAASTVPVSILLGILIGGLLAAVIFRWLDRVDTHPTRQLLFVLSLAAILLECKHLPVPFAPLVSIMAIGFLILEKKETLAHQLSTTLKKIWIPAEILLFVLIGAQVNLPIALNAGLTGILILVIGLSARSIGVWISLSGTTFTRNQKLFCILSYLPKATVQAAIGGLALSLFNLGEIELSQGSDTGELILALSVLSILITAPLGAIGIQLGKQTLLSES